MSIRNNYRGNNMIRTTQKVSTFIGNTGPTGSTGSTGAKGDTGDTGATGGSTGGLDYIFETDTDDADKGTGKVWLNNGTRSSATILYIDDNDVDSTDVSAYIATWDDSSTTSMRGYVKIYQRADNSIFSIFNISGASTDATAYHKIAVSHIVSVGTIADEDPIDVFFSRTGDAGSGLVAVVSDTTPQLGGQLDVNGQALGDGTLELLKFSEAGSAVNEFTIANAASGSGPNLSSTGGDANVDINITPKGTGDVVLAGDTAKVGDSGAAATLSSNGAGTLTVTTGGTTDLILNTNSGTSSSSITITDAANGAITLACNGTGIVDLQSSMNPSLTSTGKALVLGF